MNAAEYRAWIKAEYAGWATDVCSPGDNDLTAEDCVGDMVDSMFALPSPEIKAAIRYLRSDGVTDVKGRLADDLFEVAYLADERC